MFMMPKTDACIRINIIKLLCTFKIKQPIFTVNDLCSQNNAEYTFLFTGINSKDVLLHQLLSGSNEAVKTTRQLG